MVSSELIAVLGTIAGTILGSGIQYFNSRKSAEEASERIFEQRAFDSKFERLERLHDSLDDCLSLFREVIFQGPKDVDDYSERVRQPYDEFIDAADKARIYLDPEEREIVDNTIDEFNDARTHLRIWAEVMDDDWRDRPMNDEYEKSREELEEAADPVFNLIRGKLDPDSDSEE